MTVYPDNTSIAAGPERGVLVHRGSLEVGDVLSDLSANPMELSLLGVQGQRLSVAQRVFCISVIHLYRDYRQWQRF